MGNVDMDDIKSIEKRLKKINNILKHLSESKDSSEITFNDIELFVKLDDEEEVLVNRLKELKKK